MSTHAADIPVVAPFPWRTLLDYFRHRLIPQVERVEGERFIRRVGRDEIAIGYEAHHARLIVTTDARLTSAHLDRVAQLFDVEHDAASVMRHLQRDSMLAARVAAVPGMRPLGAWSPFELCVRTIMGQQVTVAAANTLMRRLVDRCGELTAAQVFAADLTNMGMPGRRVDTIRQLARAVAEARVQLDAPWPAIDAALQSLPGFGPWTRTYLAIRLGREPDAFPATDLGLIRAAGAASPAQLLQQAEAWRPWRSYAATYLWAVGAEPKRE